MTGRRILRLAALAALLASVGCRAWCDRWYPETHAPLAYQQGCCAPAPQQQCCTPASTVPLQPCAPAPAWPNGGRP